jgi:hypothetical protein
MRNRTMPDDDLAHFIFLATYEGFTPQTVHDWYGVPVTVLRGVDGEVVAVCGDLQLHTDLDTWRVVYGDKTVTIERNPVLALARFREELGLYCKNLHANYQAT